MQLTNEQIAKNLVSRLEIFASLVRCEINKIEKDGFISTPSAGTVPLCLSTLQDDLTECMVRFGRLIGS